ncbi:hypothetical protein V8F06_006611 [Rhypophila decipiens]
MRPIHFLYGSLPLDSDIIHILLSISRHLPTITGRSNRRVSPKRQPYAHSSSQNIPSGRKHICGRMSLISIVLLVLAAEQSENLESGKAGALDNFGNAGPLEDIFRHGMTIWYMLHAQTCMTARLIPGDEGYVDWAVSKKEFLTKMEEATTKLKLDSIRRTSRPPKSSSIQENEVLLLRDHTNISRQAHPDIKTHDLEYLPEKRLPPQPPGRFTKQMIEALEGRKHHKAMLREEKAAKAAAEEAAQAAAAKLAGSDSLKRPCTFIPITLLNKGWTGNDVLTKGQGHQYSDLGLGYPSLCD